MALGKADTGLIQADRAAYTATDPMLGLAAGAGAMASQFINVSMQQKEAKNKAERETKNKFTDAYIKGLNDNTGFAHQAAKDFLTGELNGQSDAYAAAAGDVTSQGEIITNSTGVANQVYEGEGRIKAHAQHHKGKQTRALNSDDIDTHFQDQLGAGNYILRKNERGVVEWGVKNPEGYEGREEDDGYTWFNKETLPLGEEYNNEGGAYVLNVFETEVDGRQDGYVKTTPNFKNQYKKKFEKMQMNHFGIKTLIGQDPEGDGIEGNDFYTAFINGNLPDKYYEGMPGLLSKKEWEANNEGTQGEVGTYEEYVGETMLKTKSDPEYLKAWLNGENEKGTKDYGNDSNRHSWIIDKFSEYMGEITQEGYLIKQKEQLEKENRYFVLPGEETPFMEGGKAPDDKVIKAKRLETYKNLKFETILGENYDPNNVDFNKLVNKKAEDSPLHQNIAATYATHIKNDELDLSIDGNKLIVKTIEGGTQTFNFTGKSKEDQLQLMEKLKKHLATLGPIDTELEALGTDANQWKFKKGAIFPATAEVQEEREVKESEQKAANFRQRLDEEQKVRGKITKTDSYMGGIVYFFEDGSSLNSADLGGNMFTDINEE